MSFDYNKVKAKSEDSHGNSWTAYSDLFMMLSTVFLLLYVSVSLRSQTNGIEVQIKVKQLAAKNADLEQQLQVYNALRDNQLKKDNEQEAEVYKKLMGKLELLRDEAKNEKENLRKQAKDNEEKEYALNEYQKLVRNIINTNILSKTQLQRRDVIIEKKDTITKEQKKVIVGQTVEIADLKQTVEERQQEIAANREKIDKINADLKRKVAAIREQAKESEITKTTMTKRIASLREHSLAMLKQLENKNHQVQQDLAQVQSSLSEAQKEAAQKGQELVQTKQVLAGTQAQYEKEKDDLKNQFAAKEQKLKNDFEGNLAKERFTSAQRAQLQAQFNAVAKMREAELQNKLGQLGNQLGDAQGKAAEAEGKAAAAAAAAGKAKEAADRALAEANAAQQAKGLAEADKARALAEKGNALAAKGRAEAGMGRALATVDSLQKDNAGLSADLKHAQELANARSELAKKIKGELAKAGLTGTVDGKTGDVTLSFGEEYFDTGSAQLKPSMRTTLKKFMPGYSKSLFTDEKIAKNIENVEIIGFASSTYQGRYVPPDSLRVEDREAINYNLKLSFNRANSIFKEIFDTKQMTFEHQRDLLPKIKVVGRGYLPDGKNGEDFPPNMTEKQFCTRFNCNQAQKVIIKFKLKD